MYTVAWLTKAHCQKAMANSELWSRFQVLIPTLRQISLIPQAWTLIAFAGGYARLDQGKSKLKKHRRRRYYSRVASIWRWWSQKCFIFCYRHCCVWRLVPKPWCWMSWVLALVYSMADKTQQSVHVTFIADAAQTVIFWVDWFFPLQVWLMQL